MRSLGARDIFQDARACVLLGTAMMADEQHKS